jgi:hypothetical protein
VTDAAPRPWRAEEFPTYAGSVVHYVRIFDANGGRVADLYPHESVGGKGIDHVRANAAAILAGVNGDGRADPA